MKTPLAGFAIAILVFLSSANECVGQSTPPPFPNPVLYLTGQEAFSARGRSFIRYRYGVANSDSYSDAMFTAAPTLPPCGSNTRASRTWVDMFDSQGKRLNGFCALAKASDLNLIWFAIEEGQIPPSWIYIEITDRQTGSKYKSNFADTTN
jgi:hypothetical protein